MPKTLFDKVWRPHVIVERGAITDMRHPVTPLTVLAGPDGELHPFAIEPFRKHCLLAGLDDIGLTMEYTTAIASFTRQDRAARPWAQPA